MQYQENEAHVFSEVYHISPVFIFILNITGASGKINIYGFIISVWYQGDMCHNGS